MTMIFNILTYRYLSEPISDTSALSVSTLYGDENKILKRISLSVRAQKNPPSKSIMKTALVVCLLFCLAVNVTESYTDCISGSVCVGREAVRNPASGQILCCEEGKFPDESNIGGFKCRCLPE
ncbi:hypothetical protein RRG08_058951 [Elysia crispata]|uniref:Uncharacterized protein n=1 Tax=Elysia crispata TaxID=231223 RepID=A0AAE0XRW9_9GAST|nr:hypothetical protein RRG08_058951 [Elysia crispata]